MQSSLTILERYVLETLGNGPKTFYDIQQITNLEMIILDRILKELLLNQLVNLKGQNYSLNLEKFKFEISRQSERAKKEELKDLLAQSISGHFSNQGKVNLKKVVLSERDEKIFKAHLNTLEAFINSIDDKNLDSASGDKKVVFWGICDYFSMIKNTLEWA